MSVEAVGWALNAPLGGNAKIMLLGMANHAHADGTEAYPSLDTLARYGNCDRSTARRNVRKLVEEGWLIEDGAGPQGQAKYILALERGEGGGKTPRGGKMPRGGKTPPEGVASEPEGGGIALPPEPSIEPSSKPSSYVDNAGAQAGDCATDDPRNQIPEGFPQELRPHAREVTKILRHIAADHGAKKVWPLAVGRVVMAHPRKPLVRAAHDFAAWAVDPPREIKDAVATYRNWLNRVPELEAIERLAPDGTPTSARIITGGSVTHIGVARRDRKGDDGTDAERARRMLERMRAQRGEQT